VAAGSKKIIKEALGSRVAADLREAIVLGEIPASQHLVEAELALRYGVSRGPIRDAFKILHAEGLVENQRQGVIVTGIGVEDINEIYSLRGILEELAIRLVMEKGSAISLDALEHAVQDMMQAAVEKNPEKFGLADIDFHNALCLLSGHRRLADVWKQYKEIMMTLLRLTIFQNNNLDVNAARHMEFFELIKTGNYALAQKELAEHLEGSRQRMVAVWTQAIQNAETGVPR
jgi:GntR family transcriptional regulator of gluconate operon